MSVVTVIGVSVRGSVLRPRGYQSCLPSRDGDRVHLVPTWYRSYQVPGTAHESAEGAIHQRPRRPPFFRRMEKKVFSDSLSLRRR